MSNTSSSWLCSLLKHHKETKEDRQQDKEDLKALAARPEAEALRAWLASRALPHLQPIQALSPQWEAHKRHSDARLELIRELYLLLEPDDV